MRVVQAFVILAAALGGLPTISSARAEMPPYPYCMIGTPNMGRDCTFSTLEQCRIAASAGVGFCQDNPAYTAARRAVPASMRR